MPSRAQKVPVRYAVVGLGHIAQVAAMPAFAHASANSRVVAVVSGDAKKRRALVRKYRLEAAYDYADYNACLRTVDAVYIGLPNSMHAEFAVRAAEAKVHVLCEKPLAVTAGDCDRIVKACADNGVRLMTAYRLHFEAVNMKVAELVRRGRIGEPRFFNSCFSMRVEKDNIRAQKTLGGGSLYDIGIYCINAARWLFRSEPVEVAAISTNPNERLAEIDATTGALLRFEDGRVAAFVTSFDAADTGSFTVVGTKGSISVDPAFEYAEALAYTLKVGERTSRLRGKRVDQFAAELFYFSNCIRKGIAPEPSGEDGAQDVRIIEALYEAAETGKVVAIPPYRSSRQPSQAQKISRPPVRKPRLVNVAQDS